MSSAQAVTPSVEPAIENWYRQCAREDFASRFAACAAYVLHELDFWAAVDRPA